MYDRSVRAKNIILHNIAECDSSETEQRVSHDTNITSDVLRGLGISSTEFRTARIGRITGNEKNKPRPLKVVFSSEETARNCILNKLKLIISGSAARISADQTISKRKYFQQLREELARRQNQGEKDLLIKYINGEPQIVHAAN